MRLHAGRMLSYDQRVGKFERFAAGIVAAGVIALVSDPGSAVAKETTSPPKSLFVQVYASDGVSENERLAITKAITVGLQGGATSDVTSAGAGPSDAVRKQVAKTLADSDAKLEDARDRIKKLDLEGAIILLERASVDYTRLLPELVVRDFHGRRLLETHVQLAIAHFLDGSEANAGKALTKALVLDPSLEFSTKQFPPQLDELVVSARIAIDELGFGAIKIEVAAGTSVVTVYVNGDEKGRSPLTVSDLAPGPHTVHLRALGMEPKVVTVVVEGGDIATVKETLESLQSKVVGVLAGTRALVGAAKADDELVQAAVDLGVEGLVLVVPTVADDQRLQLTAYLYDMRRRRLVSRAMREIPRDELSEATLVGRAVYGQVQWDALGAVEVHSPPIWQHKYFWPAVGTAAGVIVLGVVVGIVANDGLSPAKKAVLFPITTRF